MKEAKNAKALVNLGEYFDNEELSCVFVDTDYIDISKVYVDNTAYINVENAELQPNAVYSIIVNNMTLPQLYHDYDYIEPYSNYTGFIICGVILFKSLQGVIDFIHDNDFIATYGDDTITVYTVMNDGETFLPILTM